MLLNLQDFSNGIQTKLAYTASAVTQIDRMRGRLCFLLMDGRGTKITRPNKRIKFINQSGFII